MSVKDLISAIASGSAIETENAFNQVMAEKISARLDDMRVEVAQSMFKEEVEVTEEVELTLEDFSAEEIEEFMVSEDYEQLDELSKTTLKSYRDKANKQSLDNDAYLDSKFARPTRKERDRLGTQMSKRDAGVKLADKKLAQKTNEDLDNYSVEEIKEFMVSEDYEQLDELSKDTLARYVHAAGKDKEERTRHGADLRKADDDLGNASFAASSRHVTNPKTRADAQNAISAARSEVSKAMNQNDDKKFQRGVGIRKALKKLSK